MFILKTFPEMHDQVRLPNSDRVARVVFINHGEKTVTVETANGEKATFPWDEDLELVAYNPTRTVACAPQDMQIEIIQRTSQMDCFEHEVARKEAEAIFS